MCHSVFNSLFGVKWLKDNLLRVGRNGTSSYYIILQNILFIGLMQWIRKDVYLGKELCRVIKAGWQKRLFFSHIRRFLCIYLQNTICFCNTCCTVSGSRNCKVENNSLKKPLNNDAKVISLCKAFARCKINPWRSYWLNDSVKKGIDEIFYNM